MKYQALYEYMQEQGPEYLDALMQAYVGNEERLRNLFDQIRTNPDEIDFANMSTLQTQIRLIIQMYHHPDQIILTGIEQDQEELERYRITISMQLDAVLFGYEARLRRQAAPEPNIPAPAPEPAPAPAPVLAVPGHELPAALRPTDRQHMAPWRMFAHQQQHCCAEELMAKVIVIGGELSNKSKLCQRIVDRDDSLTSTSTVGVDWHSHKVGNVNLQLWDTTGQERYTAITSSYYKNAKIFILCFSAADQQSFRNLTGLYQRVQQNAPEATMVLVCTDLELIGQPGNITQQEIDGFMHQHMQQHNNIIHYQGCSVTNCEGIPELEHLLANIVRQRHVHEQQPEEPDHQPAAEPDNGRRDGGRPRHQCVVQ